MSWQARRGTAAQWVTADPLLDPGELGVEIDTGRVKAGMQPPVRWTLLPYVGDVSSAGYLTAADLVGLVADTDPRLSNPRTPVAHTHPWGEVTGRPTTFAPSAHTHPTSDVVGLSGAISGAVASSAATTLAAAQAYADAVRVDVSALAALAEESTDIAALQAAVQALADSPASGGITQEQLDAEATARATGDTNTLAAAATDAQTRATTARTSAISTAAADATTKADTARTSAVATAAADATSKAGTAETNAKAASTPIAHATNTSNPHATTKAQVGLGNVDNTADATKPVSAAQAAADTAVSVAAAADATSKADAAAAASLARTSNLSDLTNPSTARTNLGLGTAATQASTAFETAGAAAAVSAATTTALAGKQPNAIIARANPVISPGIVNTTAETSMFDLVIPAARVAAGDLIHVDAAWDVLNFSGAAANYTYRLRLGSTTVLQGAAISQSNNSQRGKAKFQAVLSLASLTDQRIVGHYTGTGGGTPTLLAITAALSQTGVGVAAEDMSTDTTLSLLVTMGTASPVIDVRPYFAVATRSR